MTPLPTPLGGRELVAWRLDETRHAPTWDSGEGAYLAGGRWNSVGKRSVYCSIDPATAIMEVAVHKGFEALDTVPHTLSAMIILNAADVHVVQPSSVPNARWLTSGIPSAGQQAFGDRLLSAHKFILIPSAVSLNSWNLFFDPAVASGAYSLKKQEAFTLDTRLNRPKT